MPERLTGFGIGLRNEHLAHVVEHHPEVAWFEIISENFMDTASRPRHLLDQVISRYPIAMHGVSLGIGSPDEPSAQYLSQLKALAEQLKPKLVTDHLCWTRYHGEQSYDLLPLSYNREALRTISDRMKRVQDLLGRQILLENPSAYLCAQNQDFEEAEFLSELCHQSGCGILLDLNNLYVNQFNLGLDPIAYLETIPHHAVGQFHLAGHSRLDDVIIDTHDDHVCEPVLNLFQLASSRWPDVPTLLEWDDKIPPFEDLVKERDRCVASLGANISYELTQVAPKATLSLQEEAEPAINEAFLNAFWKALWKQQLNENDFVHFRRPQHGSTSIQSGLHVYREGFFLRAWDVLEDQFPCLYSLLSEAEFRTVVTAYLRASTFEDYSIDTLGAKLPDFLGLHSPIDFGVPSQAIADLAQLEWAKVSVATAPRINGLTPLEVQAFEASDWTSAKFLLSPDVLPLELDYDVKPLMEACLEKQEPVEPERKRNYQIVYRQDFAPHILTSDATTYQLLHLLEKPITLESAIASCANDNVSPSELAARFAELVFQWSPWISRD